MTLEELRAALKTEKPGKIAEATGLHRNTIRNVREGLVAVPTDDVLDKLRAHFAQDS